jgi:hypothetical protein
MDPETVRLDKEYVCMKLGLDADELEGFFRMPKRFYWNYRNQQTLFNVGAFVLKAAGFEPSIKR